MRSLQHLDLSGTQITDTGLGHLSNLPLVFLSLAETEVTDSGLEVLEGLGQLQRLDLTGTEVTSTAIEKLEAALPNCEVQK